jgi:serine/threonine protein kinase
MNNDTTRGPDPAEAGRWRPAGEVYDEIEADLKAGGSPRIEAALEAVAELERPGLLPDLVAVEIVYRRRRGEHPTPGDYAGRFPGREGAIPAAFDAVPDPKQNLMVGALGLRLGLVTDDDLIAACEAWVDAKHEPLARVLASRGSLPQVGSDLLGGLAPRFLAVHGGDPRRGLAALGLPGPVRAALETIGDPELRGALAHAGSPDPDEAASRPRFRILEPDPRGGGMGAVFKARDEQFDRVVALKQVRSQLADSREHRARLNFEATITGRLEHPSIVPAYARGRLGDGQPYYVMRFIDGPTLEEAIEDFHAADRGRRDPEERGQALRRLLRPFIAVCRAIDYAHYRNVVHADLKPRNVMLREKFRFGETLVVDWGLARLLDGAGGSSTSGPIRRLPSDGDIPPRRGSVEGTYQYMAPEQARGEPADRASDIFGLGATLYQILAGTSPYRAPACDDEEDMLRVLDQVGRCDFRPPHLANPCVPRGLSAICLKAMAWRPDDRYPTPKELADDVERWLDDQPVSAYRDPLATRLRRLAGRHKPVVVGLASGLLLAFLSAWFSALLVAQKARGDAAEAKVREEAAKRNAAEILAETNFGLLRNSVFKLMDTLIDAELPRIPQSEALRRRVAGIFDIESSKVLAAREGDPRLRFDVAAVRWRAGNLSRWSRSYDDAIDYYRRAAALLEGLDRELPPEDRGSAAVRMAQVLCDEGQALTMTGRYREARSKIVEAGRLQESLARDRPGIPAIERLDASIHTYLGDLQRETGDDEEARQSFDRAVGRLMALPAERRGNWKLLALARIGQGSTARERGRPGDAERALDEAIRLVTLQETMDGAGNTERFLLARAYRERGRLLAEAASRRLEAAAAYEKAVERLTGLCHDCRPQESYCLELATAYDDRGSLHLSEKRYAGAENDFRAARTLLERLLAEAPGTGADKSAVRRQLGRTLFNQAKLARAGAQPGHALSHLEEAIEAQGIVVQSGLGNPADARLLETYKSARQSWAGQ